MEKSVQISTPDRKTVYWFADLALLFLAAVTVLGKSYENTIKAIDSSIYAGLALSMTGQGIIPHLPIGLENLGGFYGTRGFNDHPGLLIYLSGWVMRTLGPEAWTARLLPCVLSAACVPVLVVMGRHLDTRLRAWTAGLILALTISFFRVGSGFQLDGPMTLMILLSFLAWEKKWPIRTGIFTGLAIIVKAPIGLLIFPASFLTEAWLAHQAGTPIFRAPWIRRWIIALVVCLAVVIAFWGIYTAIGGWAIVADYWGRYVFGTLQGRDGSQTFDPFLFFRELIRRYWPWLPFFLYGLFRILRTGAWKTRSELLPLLALIIVTFVVSMIRFKSGSHYFLPAYPFMAWIAARPLAEWWARRELVFLRGMSTLIFVAGLACLCFPISFSNEVLPELRKFNAIIQSKGSITDRVLFINGNYPYGSFMDYQPLVNFYTGRQVDVRDCSGVTPSVANDPRVKWIIVAQPQFTTCITGEVRARFPTVYRMNTVMLLSSEPRENEIDLTPLNRELKATLSGHR